MSRKKLAIIAAVVLALAVVAGLAFWLCYRTTMARLLAPRDPENPVVSIAVQSAEGLHDPIQTRYTRDGERIQAFCEQAQGLSLRLDGFSLSGEMAVESEGAIWNLTVTYQDQTQRGVAATSDGYLYQGRLRYAALAPDRLRALLDCAAEWEEAQR